MLLTAEDYAMIHRWLCAAVINTYGPWLELGLRLPDRERRIAEHRVAEARAGLAVLTDTVPMPAVDAEVCAQLPHSLPDVRRRPESRTQSTSPGRR